MDLTTNRPGFWNNIYVALFLRLTLVLILFQFGRIAFYIANIDAYPDMTFSRFLYIMWGGLRFDISAVFYTNLLFIFLQAIPFDFRFKTSYQNFNGYLFLITNSIILIGNTADMAYYPFTLKRTTTAIFQQFANETNLLKLSFRFLIDFWGASLFGILLIVMLIYFFKKIKVGPKPKGRFWVKFIKQFLLFAIAITLTIGGLRGGYANSSRPIALSNASAYIERPNERAIVLNTPFAIYRTIGKTPMQKAAYFENDKQVAAIYSPVYSGMANANFKKKNVVLFILESFGREHVGALNKDILDYKGFTPFVDSLISVGLTYKNSYANGRKSLSGMPSAIASVPSMVEPFVLSHYSGDAINSFASLLGSEGYQTAFFHGAPNGSMGFDAFAKQAGFQKYMGLDEYNNDDDFDGYWGIWDDKFFQFYADEMNKMQEPFFTTLFSLSSHHPFQVPEGFEGMFPEGNLPIQQTIGYTDYALKHFFATASKMPWFENTIFIITADHAATFSDLPEYLTYQGFFAVPVIFYSPSGDLRGFNDSIVAQQIDIMPTVLNHINYNEPYIAFGNDLLNQDTVHFVVNYLSNVYQIFMGDYLLQFDGNKVVSFYDLKNDPLNKNNLVGKNHPAESKLLIKLKAFIQDYNRRLIDNDLIIKKTD
jgi:phosphoglycerol transferase MdoB-like AlkP superfamily enzyme